MICPDCNGTKTFALLTSVEPCPRCNGTGAIEEAHLSPLFSKTLEVERCDIVPLKPVNQKLTDFVMKHVDKEALSPAQGNSPLDHMERAMKGESIVAIPNGSDYPGQPLELVPTYYTAKNGNTYVYLDLNATSPQNALAIKDQWQLRLGQYKGDEMQVLLSYNARLFIRVVQNADGTTSRIRESDGKELDRTSSKSIKIPESRKGDDRPEFSDVESFWLVAYAFSDFKDGKRLCFSEPKKLAGQTSHRIDKCLYYEVEGRLDGIDHYWRIEAAEVVASDGSLRQAVKNRIIKYREKHSAEKSQYHKGMKLAQEICLNALESASKGSANADHMAYRTAIGIVRNCIQL